MFYNNHNDNIYNNMHKWEVEVENKDSMRPNTIVAINLTLPFRS